MSDIPQPVLDRLTDVPMPRVARARIATEPLLAAGGPLPLLRCQALVIGSGAAGLRCAVELKRRGVAVMVLTLSPFGGTSACSGSDKQTLHSAGTGGRGDDFLALAEALSAGGCMDADAAYIEAVGSIGALAGLQYLGLPLPTDRYGAVLRYRTDHDQVGRATSCGPRTSRLMVKVLAEEAVRLGIPFLRKCEAVRLLTADSVLGRKCCTGVLAIDHERRGDRHGFLAVAAGAVVLANGGPGELWRDSVYPPHCYGALGLALEAGAGCCNLTECQFGIGTRREDFPWNLSGTYMQVMPRVFSRDAAGVERDFLADWYRSTRELAANTFRKGYQWPFHATRMLAFGSSLLDLAVQVERDRGRSVFLDFLRNPGPGADGRPFAPGELDDDVAAYLGAAGALQATPIERLRRMNPLAIELYRRHGHDLAKDPLPFAVNHQHLNGGVAVDSWMRSDLVGLYAVGEAAGTHGVTRPGGAALNAGQVGGVRAAEAIANLPAETCGPLLPPASLAQLEAAIRLGEAALERSDGFTPAEVRRQVQARMSDEAGFLCRTAQVAESLAGAQRLRLAVERRGLSCQRPAQLAEVYRWRHLALASEAVLTAMAHYVAQGGGSRGARAWLGDDGSEVPEDRRGPRPEWRFRKEDPAHRRHKLTTVFQDGMVRIEERPLRPLDDLGAIFFEKDWRHFLTGDIRREDFRH